MALEEDGSAHGVLLLNSNAMGKTDTQSLCTTRNIWDLFQPSGTSTEIRKVKGKANETDKLTYHSFIYSSFTKSTRPGIRGTIFTKHSAYLV